MSQQEIDEEEQRLLKERETYKLLIEKLHEQEAGITDEDRRIREDCENDLATFVKYMWRSIDPAVFKDNWHIHAIAEHLQAVAYGDIKHLLVNVSPRCMKSIMGSVAFLPWLWIQQEKTFRTGPSTSLLYSSYGQKLSLEHSLKARTLLNSPMYKRLWGSRFILSDDQNTVTKFSNNHGGYRMSTSVGSNLTGSGASIIGVDDPHNTVEMESEVAIQSVIDWWDTALSTRLNDPVEGRFFVIMQRLRENDLSGHILDQNEGEWTHLMIPMEKDNDRHCTTSIGFSDPRTEEGELMWPERIDAKALKALKNKLGEFGSSGQLQQAPVPKGGGIIKSEWWIPFVPGPDGFYPPMEFVISVCDTAYTEKQENDFSACVTMGIYRDKQDLPKIMIMHAWQERLGLNALVNKIAQTAKRYKVDRLIIENKASGISVGQEIRRLFGNEVFGLTLIDPKGDKVARLMAVEPLFAEKIIQVPYIQDSEGNIFPRDWVEMLVKQVTGFPKAKHDDLVDCISCGVKYLRDHGLIVRREERDIDLNRRMTHTGHKQPLYDI